MSRIEDSFWIFGILAISIGVYMFGNITMSFDDNNLGLILIAVLCFGTGVWLIADFVWERLEYYEKTFWKVLRGEDDE